jgi:hypothetical protein
MAQQGDAEGRPVLKLEFGLAGVERLGGHLRRGGERAAQAQRTQAQRRRLAQDFLGHRTRESAEAELAGAQMSGKLFTQARHRISFVDEVR